MEACRQRFAELRVVALFLIIAVAVKLLGVRGLLRVSGFAARVGPSASTVLRWELKG